MNWRRLAKVGGTLAAVALGVALPVTTAATTVFKCFDRKRAHVFDERE